MKPVSLIPASEDEWLSLRQCDVTSTDAASLFGVSPYMTPFELWHRKNGTLPPDFEPNERMRWGTRLESAIAHGVAEDRGWKIRPKKEYMRLEDLRLGASFDFEILNEEAILEIKNVDAMQFRENWVIEDGELLEAPLYIEFQVQAQLAVSGKPKAYIAAFVGGNSVKVIERSPDPQIIEAIKIKAAEFWKSIAEQKPPAPDFHADYAAISKLYCHAQEGKIQDVGSDPWYQAKIEEYKHAKSQCEWWTRSVEAVKAELRIKVGDCSRVFGDGFSISGGIVKRKGYAVADTEYRNFRIILKGKKNEKSFNS